MKVNELINLLKEMPQDATVRTDDTENGLEDVEDVSLVKNETHIGHPNDYDEAISNGWCTDESVDRTKLGPNYRAKLIEYHKVLVQPFVVIS